MPKTRLDIRKLQIIFGSFVFLVAGFFFYTQNGGSFSLVLAPHTKSIEEAISSGMNFLHQAQLPYGEFKTYACVDEAMFLCQFDSSTFISTFVAYSIKNIKNEYTLPMIQNVVSFLKSKERSGGIWGYYWTGKNAETLDPDLDDTAVISYALRSNNTAFQNNIPIFEQNRDAGGVFFTWLRRSNSPNYIDCGVNANILLYLGDEYKAACTYVNDSITYDMQCSSYYPDPLSIYYLVSRAAVESASCLNDEKDIILKRVLDSAAQDGSFGSTLQTAFALNTLMNYGYVGPELGHAVDYLISKQNDDGSWERGPFFRAGVFYFGSEELTTAVVLEALDKYSLIKN